ncbi:MAG TPA: hypothetical protein VJX95_02490, partial [Oscillospiraceae bacterium]|nr:hypothetical protein [Oscillospiraceae bacterium]
MPLKWRQDKKILKQLKAEINLHAHPQIISQEAKKRSTSFNNTWVRAALPALCLAIVMAVIALNIGDRIHIPFDITGVDSGITSPSANNPYYIKVYTENTQGTGTQVQQNENTEYVEIIDAADVEIIRSAVSNSRNDSIQSTSTTSTPVVPDEPALVKLEYYDEVIGDVTLSVYASENDDEVIILSKVDNAQSEPIVTSVTDQNLLSIIEILNKNGLAGLNISNNLVRFDFALSNKVPQKEVRIFTHEVDGVTWSYAYGTNNDGKEFAAVYEASMINGIYTIAQRYPVYSDSNYPISYHTIIKDGYTVVYGAVSDATLDYYELLDRSGNSKLDRIDANKGYMAIGYGGVNELTFYNNENTPAITLSQLKANGATIYEDMWKILNPPTEEELALEKLEQAKSIITSGIKQYSPYGENEAAVKFINKAEEFRLKLESVHELFNEDSPDIKLISSQIDTILKEYSEYRNSGSWMTSIEFKETKSTFKSFAPVVTGSIKISDTAALKEYILQLDTFAQIKIPLNIGETKEEQKRTIKDLLS